MSSANDSAVRANQSPLALRVLLVEDHADVAVVTQALLKHLGHDVRRAANGPDALAIARGFQPDVALIDIGLPGMNGYELAARFQTEMASDRPILIALTGHGEEEDQCRSAAAGFAAHLVKPVSIEYLARMLRQLASVQSSAVPPDEGKHDCHGR